MSNSCYYINIFQKRRLKYESKYIQDFEPIIKEKNNDELNDHNAVFRALRDILEYACPNEFGKTDDKQETAENVRTVNNKEDSETSEDYNMTFEEAQAYCSNATSTSLRTIDERELRIIDVIKCDDEHPKVELPKWKHMPLSDQSYVDDFACVRHIITSEKNGTSTSVEVVQKGNYYIPMSDLEKFPKEK